MCIDFAEETGSGRQPPLPPELFAEQLVQKRFTNRGDKTRLVKLYTETCLRMLRGLDRIDLDDLKLKPGGGARIADSLHLCERLKALSLQRTGLQDGDLIPIAQELPSCLECLHLSSGNAIGDAGAQAVANALPRCTSLREFYISGSAIGDEGAKAIAGALPLCMSLQEIYVSGNAIGDVGAAAVALVLPECARMRFLHFVGDGIGDIGAEAICRQLPKCLLLQKIEFGGGSIGNVGAAAVSVAMPNCPALEKVFLSGSEIGDQGAKTLANALPFCTSLQEMVFWDNAVGPEGREALKLGARSHLKITWLNNAATARTSFSTARPSTSSKGPRSALSHSRQRSAG